MGEIKHLPGNECQHYVRGRCFYEERLNPGYAEHWRCQVLARWESAFDDFLSRAEYFGVAQDAVPDLWGRQFQRLARDVFHCRNYTYSHEAEVPACRQHVDGVCIMSLPRCMGRCRHFMISTSEDGHE